MINVILDTGPLVGALDRDDQWHSWSLQALAKVQRPALTCEAVLSEACFLLRESTKAREAIFHMVETGVLKVIPLLPKESSAIRNLISRHKKRMDYADGCLVRLSELYPQHSVLTTDATDFQIYRRNNRQKIPAMAP